MDEDAEVQRGESDTYEVSKVRFQPSPDFEAIHPGLELC